MVKRWSRRLSSPFFVSCYTIKIIIITISIIITSISIIRIRWISMNEHQQHLQHNQHHHCNLILLPSDPPGPPQILGDIESAYTQVENLLLRVAPPKKTFEGGQLKLSWGWPKKIIFRGTWSTWPASPRGGTLPQRLLGTKTISNCRWWRWWRWRWRWWRLWW